jgi:DNA-binding protein H-NS
METNTYAKLVKQLAELDSEIERVRHIDRSGVIAEIRAQMRDYGIKPSELVGRKRGRSPAPARYWNPETGETWTGRGQRPQWLDGKNSKEFLIVRPKPQRSDEGIDFRLQPLKV